jgi:muconolactone delta-isomerase
MEFLVEFEVTVPDGTPAAEVKDRQSAEASAAAATSRVADRPRSCSRSSAGAVTSSPLRGVDGLGAGP